MELAKGIWSSVESAALDGAAEAQEERPADWSDERWQVAQLLKSPLHSVVMLGLISATIVGIVLETDATAAHGKPPLWVTLFNRLLILPFVAELSLEFYVKRKDFFRKHFDVLSVFCVVADTSMVIVDFLTDDAIPFTLGMRLLRALRILRTARVFQVIQRFPELKYLLTQMKSAFTTIFWGLIMVLLVLLMWAIFIVNIFHPLVKEIAEKGLISYLEDWERESIAKALSSVWNVLIVLTQTLVAGDAWGTTAIPIIELHPWSYFIFLIALGTVPLCVMNLILAAIVDSGAKAREDQAFMKAAGERAKAAAREQWKKDYALELFREIDTDESGFLTREELMAGFEKNKKFRDVMRDLEFEAIDLEILFRVLDKNNSGNVDYNECLSAVVEAKAVSSQHMMVFIKFAVMDLWRRQFLVEERIDRMLELLTKGQTGKVGNPDKDGPKERATTSKVPPTVRRESSPPTGKREASPPAASADSRKGEHESKQTNDRGTKKRDEGRHLTPTRDKGHAGGAHNNHMSNGVSLRSLATVNGSAGGPKSIGTQTSVSNLSDDSNLSVVGDLEAGGAKIGADLTSREETMLSMQSQASMLSMNSDLRHVVLELSYETKKMVEQSQAQTMNVTKLDERICAVLERLQLPLPNKNTTLL